MKILFKKRERKIARNQSHQYHAIRSKLGGEASKINIIVPSPVEENIVVDDIFLDSRNYTMHSLCMMC